MTVPPQGTPCQPRPQNSARLAPGNRPCSTDRADTGTTADISSLPHGRTGAFQTQNRAFLMTSRVDHGIAAVWHQTRRGPMGHRAAGRTGPEGGRLGQRLSWLRRTSRGVPGPWGPAVTGAARAACSGPQRRLPRIALDLGVRCNRRFNTTFMEIDGSRSGPPARHPERRNKG
jgi:hypothetical protein